VGRRTWDCRTATYAYLSQNPTLLAVPFSKNSSSCIPSQCHCHRLGQYFYPRQSVRSPSCPALVKIHVQSAITTSCPWAVDDRQLHLDVFDRFVLNEVFIVNLLPTMEWRTRSVAFVYSRHIGVITLSIKVFVRSSSSPLTSTLLDIQQSSVRTSPCVPGTPTPPTPST
jgi:hypothetical protein